MSLLVSPLLPRSPRLVLSHPPNPNVTLDAHLRHNEKLVQQRRLAAQSHAPHSPAKSALSNGAANENRGQVKSSTKPPTKATARLSFAVDDSEENVVTEVNAAAVTVKHKPIKSLKPLVKQPIAKVDDTVAATAPALTVTTAAVVRTSESHTFKPSYKSTAVVNNKSPASVKRARLTQSFFLDDDTSEFMDFATTVPVVGQSRDMCPEPELKDRIENHQISVFEVDAGVNPYTATSAPHAVKKYRRAAAATKIDASDVRTHDALVMSCQYLINNVINRADFPFHEVHRYVSDRFRACRADFHCQRLSTNETIECFEWMVRFHIVTVGELANEERENFDPIQNMEKLTQTLTSLRLFYRDSYSDGHNDRDSDADSDGDGRNVNEMHGYLLLTSLNKSFLSYYSTLTPSARRSSEIQFAYQLYTSVSESHYQQFFALVRQSDYCQLCLILSLIPAMRRRALQLMLRSYHHYPLAQLTQLLCLDNEKMTLRMLRYYSIPIDSGSGSVQFVKHATRVIDDEMLWSEDHCRALIEAKRPTKLYDAIISSPSLLPPQTKRKRKHRSPAPTPLSLNQSQSAMPSNLKSVSPRELPISAHAAKLLGSLSSPRTARASSTSPANKSKAKKVKK